MIIANKMVRATLFGLVLAFTCGIYQTTDAALYASSKRCGTTVCDLLQYCSSFHNQCESCQTICQTESHNFDQELCASQCQGKSYDIMNYCDIFATSRIWNKTLLAFSQLFGLRGQRVFGVFKIC